MITGGLPVMQAVMVTQHMALKPSVTGHCTCQVFEGSIAKIAPTVPHELFVQIHTQLPFKKRT